MRSSEKSQGHVRASLLLLLLLLATPREAGAQVFLAERPRPEFTIGPLFVRASVSADLGAVPVEILWTLVIPPTRSAVGLEQDLFLLWPGAVIGDPTAGPPDPALARYVAARGFTVIDEGRLALRAQSLYQMEVATAARPLAGGAPFVTFVREGGALGLTSPATYVRIPWTPYLVNRAWLMNLHMPAKGLIKEKPATWFEHTFWGERHRLSLSFNDVRQRVLFPFYLEHRDRVVRLAEDPAQILINFADTDHLKIDELFPQSAKRQVSETLESTETVSLFLDRSEGITPQVLTVQFGYFSGLQAWAPILIPTLFFVLGNVAGAVIRGVAERLSRRVSSSVQVGRQRDDRPSGETGVLLSRDALSRITPGETTYEDVIRLCGPELEEQARLTSPGRQTLVYRGRRIVPHRRRIFGWLATVSHWDVEHHEVEIEIAEGRVRDVQTRVRRTRLQRPDTG